MLVGGVRKMFTSLTMQQQPSSAKLSGTVLGILLIIWIGGLVVNGIRYLQAQQKYLVLIQQVAPIKFLRGDPGSTFWVIPAPDEITRMIHLFYMQQSSPELEKARIHTWRVFLEIFVWGLFWFIVIIIIASGKQIS
jgi:hypothetical protein